MASGQDLHIRAGCATLSGEIPTQTATDQSLFLLFPRVAVLAVKAIGEMPVTREFSVIVERDSEGFYVASVPQLPGCHTQARSLDTLMKRIREAIELCLEVQAEDIAPQEFVGVQRVLVEV